MSAECVKTPVAEKEKVGITKKGETTPKNSKRIVRWIAVLLILFMLSGGLAFMSGLNSKSINLTISFYTVSSGRNPDGSPFDIQEIMSEEVLSMAVEKLGGKIDTETLRKHLTVSHNVSAGEQEKVKQNILAGNGEYAAIPTAYTLTYSTVSEKIRHQGVGASLKAFFEQFNLPDKATILEAVVKSYDESYRRKYAHVGDALNADWDEVAKMDYYNRATVISTEAGQINTLLLDKYNQDTAFVSENTGIGYGELYTECNNIINIDIANFKAFIVQNGLSTNKELLMKQFRYMELDRHETNYRQLARYDVVMKAIDYYDSNVTKVVFIPALDYDESFYMNRTKVGMDYLIEDATNTKVKADEALHDEEMYIDLRNRFEKAPEANAEIYAEAERMYEALSNKIENLVKKTAEILEEDTTTKSHVHMELGTVYANRSLSAMARDVAEAFIHFALIAYLIKFAFETVTKKKRKS